MKNSWHQVWSNRKLEANERLTLETLIRLNGFDTGIARITSSAWLEGLGKIAKLIGIQGGDSVLEFGCGSGAFLFALNKVCQIKGSGIDYSSSLIDIAKTALPEMDFTCEEAGKVSSTKKFDYCVSHSVFHYFSETYAENVLGIMAAKARKAVVVLEVPDAATKELAEKLRRRGLQEDEYAEKYAGLDHNYYPRKWFSSNASKLGMTCEFLENQINYDQKDFRYGCILRRQK